MMIALKKTESGWKFKHRELHADVIENRDLNANCKMKLATLSQAKNI